MDEEETRSSLLIRVRNPADHESWREFVTLYEPLLLAYARSQGLDDADARDLTQDVLIKLYSSLSDFTLDRRVGRFRTWLWRLTSNAMIDQRRRQARWDRAEKVRAELPVDGADPNAEWLRLHRKRVMEFVLDQIRAQSQPKTWSCFEMHTLQGRPAAEIGTALGLSANAVYVNCSNVLGRVRKMCGEYLEDLDDGGDDLPS